MMRATILTAFFTSSLAFAGSITNESSFGGDFSGNFAAPNSLSFSIGSNEVYGSLIRVSTTVSDDKDYITFSVPTGSFIVAINVLTGTIAGGAGGVSFIGIDSGTSVLDPATASGPLAASLLGYTLYGASDIGKNILGRFATSNLSAPPAQGFSQLGAGDYTIWIQEGAVGTYNYALDIVIATPEPETWLLTGLAMAVIPFLRKAANQRKGRSKRS